LRSSLEARANFGEPRRMMFIVLPSFEARKKERARQDVDSVPAR
jgi:hypothetical protein